MEKNISMMAGSYTVLSVGEQVVFSVETMPQRWMKDHQNTQPRPAPTLTPDQLTSVSAMIAYIAHHSRRSEFHLERDLADTFKVANVKFLAAQDFDKAIRYLADIFPPRA